MKHAHVQLDTLRSSAPIVELSFLEADARRNARKRTMDGWMAAAVVGLLGAFTVVLYPAMETLVAH